MDREKKPVKKITSEKVALEKAQSYCAYQERHQQEVRDKLYEWGLWPEAVENTISNLITDNFLNEERFAKAFAGGKFRIKKWGRVKIKTELKKRKISDYCIKKGMQEIDSQCYMKTLKQVLDKKLSSIKAGTIRLKNQKAAYYTISRGFESDLVWDTILNKE
jgi:regulatory protein